jgi:RNA polymerase sigma-70 factor, ECF subfamily
MVPIERGLIERAREGGPALEELLAAVWPQAFRVAFAILHDRGLAEDAAQEACAAIARSLHSLKSPDAFGGWSHRVVVSHALIAARRRPNADGLDVLTQRSTDGDRSDALDLYDALASLTPLQRAVLLLRYYAGLRSSEIAVAAGVPASTVRFQLMRARRALRKKLDTPPARHLGNEVLIDVH